MKTRLKKLIHWVVINSFIACCFYFGITQNNDLTTLGQALTWINAFICFGIALMFVGNTPETKKRRAILIARTSSPFERMVPNWLALSYDLTLSAYLAYHSYAFTGLAVLSSFFFQAITSMQFEEDINQPKSAAAASVTNPHSHASPPEHSPHSS